MGMFVVDVSSHQTIDAARNPAVGATIVKVSQGITYINTPTDHSYWRKQVQAALDSGKKIGLYHYAGGNDPVAEADYFLGNISDFIGKAVLAVDWESEDNKSWGNSEWVKKFVTRVHDRTGIYPIIYVQASAISQVANCVDMCGLWVASYPYDKITDGWTLPNWKFNISPWKQMTGWQFTSTASTLDKSYFYVDGSGWDALAKGSGASDQVASTTTTVSPNPYSIAGKNLETLADDVIANRVGNGDERRSKLGNLANATQAIVNYKLKAVSYDSLIATLKSEVLAGRLGDGTQRQSLLGSFYQSVQNSINSSTTSSARYYTVKSGDTLSEIGSKLGVNWATLARNNGIRAPYIIKIGQHIKY